jgi:hypothetical protein
LQHWRVMPHGFLLNCLLVRSRWEYREVRGSFGCQGLHTTWRC